MSDFAEARAISATGLRAQATRLRHLSENIANADTPGYRRKTISFEEQHANSATPHGVETGKVRLDQSELAKIYDPSHPLADDSGHYQGSNVALVMEITDAQEAQRSYEANLKMFDQARQMSAGLLDLLRR